MKRLALLPAILFLAAACADAAGRPLLPTAPTSAPRADVASDPAKASQTITFDALLPSTFGAQAFSVEGDARASSGLAVTFASATSDRCTVTADGSAVQISDVGVGDAGCALTASQDGDAYFAAAPAVTQRFDIYNKIDIYPTVAVNAISWGAKTKDFPVAILTMKSADGSTVFSASRVDPTTLTIQIADAKPGEPARVAPVELDSKGRLRAFYMDANGDCIADLLVFFVKTAVFGAEDVSATAHQLILSGNLKLSATDAKQDGRAIRGVDDLRLDP
jgi:hypothetical protein